MGTTAEKLTYLNGTKRLLRRRINSLGGNITLETKFRDYLLWLDRFYNAASSPVDFEILGETTQKAVNTSANLLYIPDDEIVTDGVTVTISNGKITINGTPTRDLYIKITNGMEVEYTNPRPNDNHRWYKEKLCEFDEPTTLILQVGKGGGTVASSGNLYHLGYHDTYYPEATTTDPIRAFADNVTEEKKISGGRYINNVTETNFVMFYLIEGEPLNTYGYLSLATSSQTYWTPNSDAAPPSPDNPKTIINKTGNIIYTASDGTEFPVSLGDIELCGNPDPNGPPDRLFYSQGMFLVEQNISSSVYDGASESWYYDSTADVYKGALHGNWSYTPSNYGISNYFKNVVDSNIVDESTAGANLNNGEFAISYHSSGVDNTFYLKYTDLDEDDPMETTAALKAWLSTHNTIIQFEIAGPDYILITPEEYPTLYGQLQAIIDYETKLQIEEKIF